MNGGGADGGGDGPDGATTKVGELRIELLADLAVPSIVRERCRRWLDGFGWPPDERDDVVMAVHEAVANVIDHAYRDRDPGPVRVTATMRLLGGERGQVDLAVRDWGRWRPVEPDPGFRGHGLQVMNACMRSVEVRRGPAGTEVAMTSPAVDLGGPSGRPATPQRLALAVVAVAVLRGRPTPAAGDQPARP